MSAATTANTNNNSSNSNSSSSSSNSGGNNSLKRTAANAALSDLTSNTATSSSKSLSPPPEKRPNIFIEPPKLDTIESADDLDKKILRVQNKKLKESLEFRLRTERELREKLQQLKDRKTNDDAKLYIFDRYWTQLDDDLRLLLERFDSNKYETNENDKNFSKIFHDWDKKEIDDKLKERVKFTTQAIVKLLVAYDKTIKKQEKYYLELHQHINDTANGSGLETSDYEQFQLLKDENIELNKLVKKCHEEAHRTGLKQKEYEDRITQLENEIKDLKYLNDENEYQLEKSKDKIFKLERNLSETMHKLNNQITNQLNASNNNNSNNNNNNNNGNSSNTSSNANGLVNGNKPANISERQLSELQAELNEQRDLAANRLSEIEKLNLEHQQTLKQIEKLKFDLKMIPETVIEQSAEYKILLAKYSVIVADNLKIKQSLDEMRNLLDQTRTTFQRQIEQMESEELENQKRLGNELMQLEEQLAIVRKENELLRIEYEQNVAANEQTGPINKEMRSLIETLQTNNKLLKSDNLRCKKRLQELQDEFEKYKNETNTKIQQLEHQTNKSVVEEGKDELPFESVVLNEDFMLNLSQIEVYHDDTDTVKELKEKLKKSADYLKNFKSLIDRNSNKKLDDAKAEIKRLKESINKNDSSVTPSVSTASGGGVDYSKKIKQLEDNIRDLHRNLSNKKQEETALLNDMEITGQAYEDMQEQNIRLMQQLREKDEANFNLMSERIKLETAQKALKEEKEILIEQVTTLQEQLDAQINVTKKLEEQVIHLQHNVIQLETEIRTLQQTFDETKRKAIQSDLLVFDLKLHTQKYITQLKETQTEIAEKTESLSIQSSSNNRLQEEIKHLKLQLERQKKFEYASNLDEVLQEENREYKEQLRCPSCKVKQKDAVLTKCFHVFCFDCLQKRYELRQRKCPKCNANFGANDYRKLYF